MGIKLKDLRKMTREERLEKLRELRDELMKLRMKARIGTVENPGKIRSIRKTIARILTIEREEQLKAQSTKK
ncbi:MAG: 50S ribosomal protein L29 [Fervidicoccaceae archaeon]|jgi:large subunit ribosomal protein L29|uniref:Large ribosomal subunit protein uL29 n=1 Tax=Fervidicoccus fontis TaxID=683846 RepID=A0A7C1E1W7_9CREN|nr:50S ribosomal protein L29 [Fervidicoccaceae archaeon]MCC6052228.1 50S ribosomal protein L29 [Fervidicoccaceae archaeon]NAZ11235.1 50S ribosomal protein L29 [Desulfurococcales archaeon]